MFGKCAQHARAGDQPGRARSTAGRPAWGSTTSTASTRARRTSITPSLYRNTTPVAQPKTPEQGYHFTADMTDEAIAWTRNIRAADPDKPWFVYFSTSGVHAPHHAPQGWRDKYKGKFDHGWDKQRELTHAKQLEMGVIPKGTKLTPRPESIPAWDEPLGRREEGLRPADGELRRLHGLHRLSRSAG